MDDKKCSDKNVANTRNTVSRGVGPSPGGVVTQGKGLRTSMGQNSHHSQDGPCSRIHRDKLRNLKIVEQTSYTYSAGPAKKLTTTGVGSSYKHVHRTLQVNTEQLDATSQRGLKYNTQWEPRSVIRQTKPQPPNTVTTQITKHLPLSKVGPCTTHRYMLSQDKRKAGWQQHQLARPRALGYPNPLFASVHHYDRHEKVKPTQTLPLISVHGEQYKGQGERERSQGSSGGPRDDLRHVVIDGCNVAYSHGHHSTFSGAGIHIAASYFLKLGHKVSVVLPQTCKKRFRKLPLPDQERLRHLEDSGVLVYTPVRNIHGRYVHHHEDRMLLRLAEQTEAVIVSNGLFRDLMTENKTWKKMVEERLLMFTFAGNIFMPLEDPLGRDGPSLKTFLTNESCRQSKSRPSNVARVLPVPIDEDESAAERVRVILTQSDWLSSSSAQCRDYNSFQNFSSASMGVCLSGSPSPYPE